MSRSERWDEGNEIKRRFHETTDPESGAGAIIYYENGKKYCDDSEKHIGVIGRTGMGKSQCCSHPFMREIFQKNESLVMLDPKGEGYRLNACYIPKHYQVFCVDFRNPRKSPDRWNPLEAPLRLFRSADPDDHDTACSMVNDFWRGVFPYDEHAERFWTDASIDYAQGLTYGLFETAPEEQVNLDSIATMMEQSEIRLGLGTVLKDFYEALPSGSLAKRNLASYATAPNETRASIHSVAAAGVEIFSRSRGLMEMLGEDTLNLLELDVDRPFALIIITPDETDTYDALAGLLVSQVSGHLMRVAQERGGSLPIRVNIILEELGSVGRCIPKLTNLMVAGRSRNIRLMLILQSRAQLVDVFGESKAEAIDSCLGITIGFSTNNWETLKEWSQRCGERQVECNGQITTEPLITASQLAAMPTGTALVMVGGRYKFIAHLPLYHEMYDNSGWKEPCCKPAVSKRKLQSIDFEALVKGMKQKCIEASIAEMKRPGSPPPLPPEPLEIDSLMAQINARIAELDAEEKKTPKGKYHVLVTAARGNRVRVAKVIAAATGMSLEIATQKLSHPPVDLAFGTKGKAVKFAQDISEAGGEASIKTA